MQGAEDVAGGGWHGCRRSGYILSRKSTTLREEEANKITFTNDFSERTERKERNQYQQSNDAGCDQLIESYI
jgi:hypothetical protein